LIAGNDMGSGISSTFILMTPCPSSDDVILVSQHERGKMSGETVQLCKITIPFLISASSVMVIKAHLH
jgi:hypothetical protein